jgi:VCBS repeat-containing protein
VNDSLSLPNIRLTSGLTFEAWINTSNTNSGSAHVAVQTNPIFGDTSVSVWMGFGVTGGKLNYTFYTNTWNSVTSANSVANGQWRHVAVTHDTNGQVRLYIDGQIEATATLAYNEYSTTAVNRIGSGYGNQNFFQGSIDTPTIYSRALTQSELMSRYLSQGWAQVNENATNGSVVGTFTATDADAADTLTYSLVNNAGGRFAVNSATGQITVANGSLLDFEASTSHTVVLRATDLGNLTADQTITISLNNVNEAPVAVADTGTAVEAGGVANGTAGTNPTGNILTNDTDVDVGDTKTVSGVAAGAVGSAIGSVGTSVTGTYGSINIAANGAYTYTVDNTNSTVQALRTSAQTLTDVFTYTMADSGGLTSTTQVTITIQGANDAPVGVNDTATAVEAGGVNNSGIGFQPVGNVLTNDTDVDAGDTKAVNSVGAGSLANASGYEGNVGSSVTGTYGSITINSDGSYQYNVDNSNSAVQALRLSSQTLADVFTYQVVDTAGLTSLATITVAIQGANDTPTAVVDTATAIEAGGTANATAGANPMGNVLTNDTDVDTGDTKTVSGVAAGVVGSASTNVGSAVTGTYGSINISSTGAYT